MKDIKQVLATLKVEYLEAFPKKIALIKKLTSEGNLDLLREEYHKLKGTGKTYGFPDVSVVCAILENILEKQKNVDAKLLTSTHELLERMYQHYEKDQVLDLSQDEFAKALLAMKSK